MSEAALTGASAGEMAPQIGSLDTLEQRRMSSAGPLEHVARLVANRRPTFYSRHMSYSTVDDTLQFGHGAKRSLAVTLYTTSQTNNARPAANQASNDRSIRRQWQHLA